MSVFSAFLFSASMFFSPHQLPEDPLPHRPFRQHVFLDPLPSPFSPVPPSLGSSLSSHFLHHDPLLGLFKPVLLSLPLPIFPSLILRFLILLRDTPDTQFIHPSPCLHLFPPPSSSFSTLFTFFFVLLVHTSRTKKGGAAGKCRGRMRGGWGESGNKINGLHLGKERGGEKSREGG